VGIARQILENLIWAAKWWFGIDDPFGLAGLEAQRLESRRFGQRFQRSTELEFPLLEGSAQMNQKPLPKNRLRTFTGRKNDLRQEIQRD
jgi:hypothetical protein